jgi:hypothetical protein
MLTESGVIIQEPDGTLRTLCLGSKRVNKVHAHNRNPTGHSEPYVWEVKE